jgi:hypothetical protein
VPVLSTERRTGLPIPENGSIRPRTGGETGSDRNEGGNIASERRERAGEVYSRMRLLAPISVVDDEANGAILGRN